MNRSEMTLLILREIAITADSSRRRLRETLPQGLGEAQFDVLSHLTFTTNRNETPSDLARSFHVTRPAMTQTLNRLRTAGLIELVPARQDGRVRYVRLTAAGRARHGEVVGVLEADIRAVSRRFSNADLEGLLQQARRFRLEMEQTAELDTKEHSS